MEREKDDLDVLIEEELARDPEFRKVWQENENIRELGFALVDARARAGMTQRDLAKKSGVAQGDISVLESGKTNPKFNTLCKLADAMGMKIKVTFVPKDAT